MSKKDKSDKSEKGDKKNKAGKKKEATEASLHSLGPALVQTARALRTVMSRNLAESGLYAGQDGVILTLAEENGMTPGALATRLGVKAPTMTRTIGRLEAQGFVERGSDTSDARLTKVFLTESGRTTLAMIEAANADCETQAARGLSGKELRQLVKLLSVVEQNLADDAGDDT